MVVPNISLVKTNEKYIKIKSFKFTNFGNGKNKPNINMLKCCAYK